MRTFARRPNALQQATSAPCVTRPRHAELRPDSERRTIGRELGGAAARDFSQVPARAPSSPAARTQTTVARYPLRATVRRRPPGAAGMSRADAPAGWEQGDEAYRAIFESLAAGPEGVAAEAGADLAGLLGAEGSGGAGGAIQVPDIQIAALAEVGRADAVNGAFAYSGSIARGGAQPAGFGVTRSFDSRLTGVVITPAPGTFNVAATFEHPITYQIRSGRGPSDQVDIASATDNDITSGNYPTVVSDLTPDMTDLNGRPPRTAFWAEDLTESHEIVHANDDQANGPGAMATVTAWLNAQVAASAAQVTALLGALPGRFATALLAALSTEDGERHAYGDGAAAYQARADAIKAKGDRGEYPARRYSTAGGVLGGLGGLIVGGAAGAGIGYLAGGETGAVVGGIIGGVGGLIGGIFAGRRA